MCIILVTIINATSNNLGAFVSNLFLILKISSVTIICLFGFSTLVKSQLSSDLFADSSTEIGDYALALFYALFAYDGWNNLNLVSGELRNPSKNIPLALSISMLIITICYILVNVAFYTVIPKDILLSSTSIALDFGKIVFGHFGKLIICLSVLASTFGTLNASIFTAARIVHTSALSGHAPKIFSKLSNQDTPINSILQQCVFSIGFVIVGNFNQLVNFYSIIAWSFYFLTVLGLVVLRFKEPLLDRPFKVWFIIPILFCASSLFLVVVSVFEAPIEAIAALIFQLFGLIIWFIVFYQKRRILDRLDWFIGMVDRVRGGYQATNQDETN